MRETTYWGGDWGLPIRCIAACYVTFYPICHHHFVSFGARNGTAAEFSPNSFPVIIMLPTKVYVVVAKRHTIISSVCFVLIFTMPIVLLPESQCFEIFGLPTVVFLPRTRTLTTCHFYVLKSKKFSKETGKESKMIYYIQTVYFHFHCLVTALNNGCLHGGSLAFLGWLTSRRIVMRATYSRCLWLCRNKC